MLQFVYSISIYLEIHSSPEEVTSYLVSENEKLRSNDARPIKTLRRIFHVLLFNYF